MKGANETIEYKKGHKNSRGEDAPWVIRDHKNGKVLVSFSKKDDALDYAEIADDDGNVTLLKFYKNKPSDDFKLASYDGENQKTLASGGLRYVVDRYGELLDMDPAEAIIEIAKE